MVGIGGVVVAGGAKETSAEPWAAGDGVEAETGFGGDGAGAVVECAPLAVLEDAPEEKVEGVFAERDGGGGVGAVSADADVFVVEGADGEGAVVGLGDAGAAVVVADGKAAHLHALMGEIVGVGEVLDVDVEFGVGIHVEDALVGAGGHGGEIPGAAGEVGVGAVE